jgi:hemolysin activation/secretion protein
VDPEAFPVGIEGRATTLSAFGLYPLVRSRNLNLFSIATLEAKSYLDSNGGVDTKKDVTGLSLGLTGDLRDTLLGGGINSLDLQLSGGRLSFRIAPTVDAPDERYTKLTARAVRLQNLWPGVLQGLVSLRLQQAWNNLDVTEQFRAGGPDGVRAFPAGEGAGDSGALLSLELRALLPAEWLGGLGGLAYASLFGDWATVRLRTDPTDPTVDNSVRYGGAGIGLTWSGRDGWDLRATLARPTQNQPRDEDDRPSARLYLQLGKQF